MMKDQQATPGYKQNGLTSVLKQTRAEVKEPRSPDKQTKHGTESAGQKTRNAREDKRNMIKRVIKDKLSLSNINDLVLCDVDYNYGLFGCISTEQEQFPGVVGNPGAAPSFGNNFNKDDAQLSIGQAFKSFGESSNMQGVISANGPLGFLAGMSQDNDSGSYTGGHNLLGYCAIKKKKDMTEYQRKLADYFDQVRTANPDHFKGQTKLRFSDIFRFRGLLGQGSYGVVMIVQDKIPYQIQKMRMGGTSLALFNQDSSAQDPVGKATGGGAASSTEETYALKVINKSVLNAVEIDALKGESSILRDLVGQTNVVQFMNIFETRKFIIIQMEHLKGAQMKRELRSRISRAREKLQQNTAKRADEIGDSDSDGGNYNESPKKQTEKKQQQNRTQDAESIESEILRQQEQASIMFKFGEPLKFWKHQLSFKENEPAYFDKPEVYEEEEAALIMRGILQGLNNIHEKNYIHRDLKPENIQLPPVPSSNDDALSLVDDEVKIIDFGLSAKQKFGVKDNHEEKIGTVLYMAPEQISSKSYSKKIDMYAAGIILYWMLIGHHPLYIQGPTFPDSSQTLKMKVASIGPQDWNYPCYVSPLAKDLICKLCQISQTERYDAKRAMIHPWVTRRFMDKIPLTAKEEGMRDELEEALQRGLRKDNTACSYSQLSFNPQSRHLSNVGLGLDGILGAAKGGPKGHAATKLNQLTESGPSSSTAENLGSTSSKFQSILNTGIKQFTAGSGPQDDPGNKSAKARQAMLSEQYGISKSYLEKILRAVHNNEFAASDRRSQNEGQASGCQNSLYGNHQGNKSKGGNNSKSAQKSDQKMFTNKRHQLSYLSPEKQYPSVFHLEGKLCDTPDFVEDPVNKITIGGESMKPHTEQRKQEQKQARGDQMALNSFSNQGTIINSNLKNAMMKVNNAVNGQQNSGGAGGGHRNSTKKHIKFNNMGANTSIKKNKAQQNEQFGSQTVQKPKQMQFEYGEGMANIINGLGQYKVNHNNTNTNTTGMSNLQGNGSNFNTSESKQEEAPLNSTPFGKQKDRVNKRPGRKIVAPVPFNIDEESIRITDNSVIGNGLGVNQNQQYTKQHASRAEKLQAEANQSGTGSIQQNQGFIQVRPIFQAQNLTTKVSPMKPNNYKLPQNQQQSILNKNMPLNPIDYKSSGENESQKRQTFVRNQASGEQLNFKIELKQSNFKFQDQYTNPKTGKRQTNNSNDTANMTQKFNIKHREGTNASQMVGLNSSKRRNRAQNNQNHFDNRNMIQTTTQGMLGQRSVGKSNDSNAFAVPGIQQHQQVDMSNSLSRLSSQEGAQNHNELSNSRDQKLPLRSSKKASRQDSSYTTGLLNHQGSLSSTKNSLQFNNEINALGGGPLSVAANVSSQMEKRYPLPPAHYQTSHQSYHDSNDQSVEIQNYKPTQHAPKIGTTGVTSNLLPIQNYKMKNNQNATQHLIPKKINQLANMTFQAQQTPAMPTAKLSLLPIQQSQAKPQKSQQFFGRLAGAMLVPGGPSGGDATGSYSEKKDGLDSTGKKIPLEEKSKIQGVYSPQYDIPIKDGQKKPLDFSDAAFNLRKQHTTTNVQSMPKNNEEFSDHMKYYGKRKPGANKNENGAKIGHHKNKNPSSNFSQYTTTNQKSGGGELADGQAVVSDFGNDPNSYNGDSEVVITAGPASRFHLNPTTTGNQQKSSKILNLPHPNLTNPGGAHTTTNTNRLSHNQNTAPSAAVHHHGATRASHGGNPKINPQNITNQPNHFASSTTGSGSTAATAGIKTSHMPKVYTAQQTAMQVMNTPVQNKSANVTRSRKLSLLN